MTADPKTTLQLTKDAYESLTQAYAQFTEHHASIGFTKESLAKATACRIALCNLSFVLGVKS